MGRLHLSAPGNILPFFFFFFFFLNFCKTGIIHITAVVSEKPLNKREKKTKKFPAFKTTSDEDKVCGTAESIIQQRRSPLAYFP